MAQKFLLIIVLVPLLLLVSPSAVALAESAEAPVVSRADLLLEINRLLEEVRQLQAILASRQVLMPVQLTIFDRPFERSYKVQNGSLTAADSRGLPRPIDDELFQLFVDLVGVDAVDTAVAEWRVFYSESEDLGGFVELIPETGQWVVGVNRAGYDKGSSARRSFAQLFIHEYAHILLYEKPTFVSEFTKLFWTAADLRHMEAVSKAAGVNRFALLQAYFAKNSERFVSDYATLSPDEDLAETFVALVEDRSFPKGTIAERKLAALAGEPDLSQERSELAARLKIILK